MNKNEDLWKWALLVLVSQTVSHPWIRSDEVIGWTWSSLKTNLVLITHTYPITRSFFKILHIRNNLQSNNQLGIIFGNGECVIVGDSSTKVLLFCFKKNCYLYWGNRIPPMNAFPFLFFFFFLNNPVKWWSVIRNSVLEEQCSIDDCWCPFVSYLSLLLSHLHVLALKPKATLLSLNSISNGSSNHNCQELE